MPRTSRSIAETADAELVDALRDGDERAFRELMESCDSALLRVAMIHVGSRAVAEEVVQETWLGVIRGLDRFEGRSSLKTWIFRILTNVASSRGAREARSLPFSSLGGDGAEPLGPDRFLGADHGRLAGHWALAPSRWPTPEERLLAGESGDVIAAAIEGLPPAQRAVVALRDVEGWSAAEVCNVLDISETNQRVLLHRARSKVRQACENLLEDELR
jgi:RNA polymerase sigma-70 factor, ECF subfamily